MSEPNPVLEDVQARLPTTHVSLSRVGVTGVEKVVRINANGNEQLFYAELECFVDLGPKQKGAHMSRFEEVVNEAIGEVVLGEQTFRAETLAEHIAQLVRERQDARRAEVTVEARFPEHKPAPVSGIQTQEIYTLHGSALSTDAGTRRLAELVGGDVRVFDVPYANGPAECLHLLSVISPIADDLAVGDL